MFTDPILKSLVKKYPAPHFTDQTDHLYEKLIESIISQQLSVKASDTIYSRFLKLFDNPQTVIPAEAGIQKKSWIPGQARDDNDRSSMQFPSPRHILAMPDETIRTAGISFQKISYIKSVADAFLSDLIDVKKIKKMSDEEVIAALTQIRGVGRWTAEMALIFTLNRPDVFSLGDLGLRNAITRLYGITDKEKMQIGRASCR